MGRCNWRPRVNVVDGQQTFLVTHVERCSAGHQALEAHEQLDNVLSSNACPLQSRQDQWHRRLTLLDGLAGDYPRSEFRAHE